MVIMLGTALLSVSGCAVTFGDKLRAHRDCIGEVQIDPAKVDLCLRNTNGHREPLDHCLRDEMVSDRQIDLLAECVEAHTQHSKH